MSLDKLRKTISEKTKTAIPTQMFWCIAKDIDWNEKTMTADSIDEDEPEFNEVLLGIGSEFRKPTKGSHCLIGVIDNDDTMPFLIWAEELEEISFKTEDSEFLINDGFLLKKENETLKKLMVDLLQEIQKMKFTTNTGSTILLVNKPQFLGIENRFKTFLK